MFPNQRKPSLTPFRLYQYSRLPFLQQQPQNETNLQCSNKSTRSMDKRSIEKYYPLYPGIDNNKHSLEPYPSSSSCDTYSDSSKSFTIRSSYQDIVKYIQQFAHDYNNSLHVSIIITPRPTAIHSSMILAPPLLTLNLLSFP